MKDSRDNSPQSVLKLGPLNKVMGMIPGIPAWMAQGPAGAPDGGDRIKGSVSV
jgi:signal recognition particle GTPase